jgi:hypothetical protein
MFLLFSRPCDSRMLKKSASSVLNIREAYLVKRRSFRTRTFHASRFTNDEDDIFEHPGEPFSCMPHVRTIEVLACQLVSPRPAKGGSV